MATATVAGVGTAAKAAQTRQKKILIGGAVLLGLVLVIQVPRTMKMLSGSEAAPAPAPAAALPTAPAPGTPTTPVTPVAPASTDGTLVSFERFRTKDPFVQQVSASTGGAATPTDTGGGAAPAEGEAPAATDPVAATPTSFQTNGSPAAATGATTATLEVNGTEQTVSETKTFPKADPVFKLVSVSDDGVELAIADGSFKSGGKTISLQVGESMTLMNTADGKRYKLRLLSTSA